MSLLIERFAMRGDGLKAGVAIKRSLFPLLSRFEPGALRAFWFPLDPAVAPSAGPYCQVCDSKIVKLRTRYCALSEFVP